MTRYCLQWSEQWAEWRVVCRRTGISMWEFHRNDSGEALAYMNRLNSGTTVCIT